MEVPTAEDPAVPIKGGGVHLVSDYANIDLLIPGSPHNDFFNYEILGSGGEGGIATTDSPSSYYTADNPPTTSPCQGDGPSPQDDPTTSSEPTIAEDATIDGDSSTFNGTKELDDDQTTTSAKENNGKGTSFTSDISQEVTTHLHISSTSAPVDSTPASADDVTHERSFFCREWAWAKLWACVEQRPSAKTCGVLIVGGPGTGKTALCSQLISPTGPLGRHATLLQSRLLGFHFCHAHEAASLALSTFIRSLVVQLAESSHLVGYGAKVAVEEVVRSLDPTHLQKDPDEAFRKAILFPLLEVEAPDKTLILLVDSVDEDSLLSYGSATPPPSRDASKSDSDASKSILELLLNHHHLLPQWLLLILTARRGLHSRGLSRGFSGYRKVSLDDLRRSHVVRDVQQYILCRLDREPALRSHLSRETAEMLNQLHIKSNGCFLYLQKVLDGVVEGWVTLREIRDIPGTLNGLYLWLCQRLYPRRHFQRVLPLLAVILASRAPLSPEEARTAVATHLPCLSEDEWSRRWALLRRVLCPHTPNTLLLFHHSFAEWLLDVKHCTQKYLVDISLGHAMLAMKMTLEAPRLTPREVQTFAFHLARVRIPPKGLLAPFHLPLWLLSTRAPVATCFDEIGLRDPLSFHLLQEAGAPPPPTDEGPLLGNDDEDEEDFDDEDEQTMERTHVKYEELRDDEVGRKGEQEEEGKSDDGEKKASTEEEATQTERQKREGFDISLVRQRSLDRPPSLGLSDSTADNDVDNRSRAAAGMTRSLKTRRSGSEGPRERREEPRGLLAGSSEGSEISGKSGKERRRRKHREDPLYPYLRGGPINGVDAAGRTLLHTAACQGDASLVAVLLQRGANHSLTDRGGQTPLNLASRHGHADVVASLLSYGADPDHADDDGWTSLRSAAWAGHVGVVGALLKGGTRADLADGDGRTALRAAAWGGHEDVVAALLESGAAVNRADSEGRTPLIAAAYMGHYEIVNALIIGGADVNHADKDGRSALSVGALCVTSLVGDLCVPATEGRLQVVTALLEGGAHVDHEDKDGLTPLLVAAFEGHVDVCELLLEFDADVDHVDRSGRTPLLAAASMGHAAVVERLLFWGCYVDHIDVEGRTVLSVAAAQGSQETVRLLLDRGLDETHRDNAGWTPLHYAAFEGHRGVCEALIEGGARINEVDNDGKHALVLAAQEGHADVVATLLDAGAALHHTSHDGRSALRVAALEGHKDVVHLLLCRGADLHYKDADGRSTLYLLALEDRLEMAAFLLENGADVESKDLEGRTPLHVTSWQGHARMVELLLSHGARVDAEDHERRTPLQSAAWQGNAHIVRILLQHGAHADHCCSQGATALSIASQEGHEECVALLLQFGANPGHSDRCGRTAIKVALKGGHHRLARMLEEHLEQQKAHGGPKGLQGSSPSQASTVEAKPCSSLLCPGLTSSPAESPESTFEKRRSCMSLGGHSSSKSSCNLSSSTRSSGGGGRPVGDINNVSAFHHHHHPIHNSNQYPHGMISGSGAVPPNITPVPSSIPPVLSFTQQLQQCGRARGRKNPSLPQPPLTPLDEPSSPIYASPPISPVNDVPPPLPQRMNPIVAILEEEYALPCSKSKRHHPRAGPPMIEQASCHMEHSRKAVVVSSSSHIASHYPYVPDSASGIIVGGGLPPQLPQQVPPPPQQQPPSSAPPNPGGMGMGSTSGFTFTQDSHMRIILGSRSPEPRPKRNGIVTNPSLKAAHAKAAHILRNGLPGRPRQNLLRPNGLNIKKETPL